MKASVLESLHFLKRDYPQFNKILISKRICHYPKNPHTIDEYWMNWCKDEFVPPLTTSELKTYVNKPEKFRDDLLGNLILYLAFCQEIYKIIPKVDSLGNMSKLIALISLLYLFQSAMDNNYYKYDYLLDLEKYPRSPLGWHYLKTESILRNVAVAKYIDDKSWLDSKMLVFLSSKGMNVIDKLRDVLPKTQINQLCKSYKALQIYQKVQQEENPLFMGKNMDSIVFVTGLEIWGKLRVEIMNNFFRNKALHSVINGNPIHGTRKILTNLEKYFGKDIAGQILLEISCW